MMSLTFGLFTQVSGSGPLGPLVNISGFSTFQSGVLRLIYTRCAAHVFFIVSCSYHVTVINFSVFDFYIIVY